MGQRASFWGRGDNDANVNSDFSYLHLGVHAAAREDFPSRRAGSGADHGVRRRRRTGTSQTRRRARGVARRRRLGAAHRADRGPLRLLHRSVRCWRRGGASSTISAWPWPERIAGKEPATPVAAQARLSRGGDRLQRLGDRQRSLVSTGGHGHGQSALSVGGGAATCGRATTTIPGELDVYGVGCSASPACSSDSTTRWHGPTWSPPVIDSAIQPRLSPDDPTVYLVDGGGRGR